jgi:hypothetical protein
MKERLIIIARPKGDVLPVDCGEGALDGFQFKQPDVGARLTPPRHGKQEKKKPNDLHRTQDSKSPHAAFPL